MSKRRGKKLREAFPPTPGFCAYCGKVIHHKGGRWCGDECQNKAYIEANYGPWQRNLAKLRGFKCEKCGKKLSESYSVTDYDIHHIVPFAKCGTHKLDNLQVLCRECHRSIHAAQPNPDEVAQGRLFQ